MINFGTETGGYSGLVAACELSASTALSHHVGHVVGTGSSEQVAWITTQFDIAGVADLHPVRDRSDHALVDDAMNRSRLSVHHDLTIPIGVSSTRPEAAAVVNHQSEQDSNQWVSRPGVAHLSSLLLMCLS